MADTTRTRQKITADLFYQMFEVANQKIELINGEIMMPRSSPSLHHQAVIENLSILLGNYILYHQCGSFTQNTDIYLDEYTVLQPDLFFIGRDNQRSRLVAGVRQGAPDLCVEVLAPTTAKRDRTVKPELYSKHGVREYWILDPGNTLLEVFTPQSKGFTRSAVYDERDTFYPGVLPELRIHTADIFRT